MHIYKLADDARVLGEKDENFGFKYWAKSDKGFVMFSSFKQGYVAGTTIIAQKAEPKVSKKGQNYHWLTKVSMEEEAGDGHDMMTEADGNNFVSAEEPKLMPDNRLIYSLLRQVDRKLDKLMGEVKDEVEYDEADLQ